MLNKPGIAAEMFSSLYNAGINIQMITTSEIKISCIIRIEESQKAVKAIHDQFNLAYSKEEIIV
jgi:aspartate kinase